LSEESTDSERADGSKEMNAEPEDVIEDEYVMEQDESTEDVNASMDNDKAAVLIVYV
jgi:hypothetical protein